MRLVRVRVQLRRRHRCYPIPPAKSIPY